MSRTFYLITLGCAKNEFDSNIVKRKLKEAGYTEAPSADEADLIILNTCSFIEEAVKETFDTSASILKTRKKDARFVFAGCAVNYFREKIVGAVPADMYLSTEAFLNFDKYLEITEGSFYAESGVFNFDSESYRLDEDKKPWSYLKIAEGCSNYCSYCLIPHIRGPARSIHPDLVIREALRLAEGGKREINLIAQDLSSYGSDVNYEFNLKALVKRLSRVLSAYGVWIRLLYINPDRADFDVLAEIFELEGVVPYFEAPVQSGSERILKKMNRKRSPEEILGGVEYLKKSFPEMTFRTAFLVGFPGESEADYEKTLDFLKAIRPDYATVFGYSDMEGTASYRLKSKLPEDEILRRKNELLENAFRLMEERASEREGKVYSVMIEKAGSGRVSGRAFFQAPEIDGHIETDLKNAGEVSVGDIISIKLTQSFGIDFEGEVV
jgi:ribosomal protein S12 methylthiotransferase